jgi:hypothetical protein
MPPSFFGGREHRAQTDNEEPNSCTQQSEKGLRQLEIAYRLLFMGFFLLWIRACKKRDSCPEAAAIGYFMGKIATEFNPSLIAQIPGILPSKPPSLKSAPLMLYSRPPNTSAGAI